MVNYLTNIATLTKATEAIELEQIQSLWSGYGKIVKVGLIGSQFKTVIAKHIVLPKQMNHSRGWNTDNSHQRKIKSYQVEMNWYNNWSMHCDELCRIPKCFGTESVGEEQLIVLEDLDLAGYPIRKSQLIITEVKLCLKWLANFHAKFLNQQPTGVWAVGTYWHLATRPDELNAMNSGDLKQAATQIDALLNNCQYQTLVHGDAKVANFCFSKDLQQVAAVDFQYVGGGCGMKDVVYLLGSCLSESACENHEIELLTHYFKELETALNKSSKSIEFNQLKSEWSGLYAVAWADFTRFLMGWHPPHQKLNGYSEKLVSKALSQL